MSRSEPASARPQPSFRPQSAWGTDSYLWLVRHAEVHPDWQGRAYGNLDVPLSSAGEERTQELSRELAALPPRVVFSSPLARARALGESIAARSGAPLEVDERLAEIRRGSWEGRRVEELYRDEANAVACFYADPWSWCGHGGESDAALAARVWPAVGSALERHAGGTLVFTTHYNVIRVIASLALGMPPARSFAFRVDPGRLVLFHDAPGGWRLLTSNARAPRR